MPWWSHLLSQLMLAMSPALVDVVRQLARELRKRAAETENPIDDICAHALCVLVGADVERKV